MKAKDLQVGSLLQTEDGRVIDRSFDPSPEATQISGEHVWTDHRFNFPELLSPEGLARHINDVMTNPSLTMDLERGRTAYVDDNSGTVVISEIPLLQMAVLL